MSFIRLFFLLIFIFISSGCRPPMEEGLYQGSLFQRITDSPAPKQNVRIQVRFKNKYTTEFEVKNIYNEILDTLLFRWDRKLNQVRASIPSLGKPFLLTPVIAKSGHNCFSGRNQFNLYACISSDSFIFDATSPQTGIVIFALSGELSPRQPTPFIMEPPQRFTLEDAIQRVIAKSFDTRMQYQSVLEAKSAARAAMTNLLPHLNYRSVLGISSMNPTSIANFVADLVPFVIPTRWIKVKEAKHLSHAEAISLDILRADLTFQVESLSYAYDRDRMSLEYYYEMKEVVHQIHSHIEDIAKDLIGYLGNPMDELELRSDLVSNFVDQEIIRLENALVLDRTALSLALGFNNPQAVKGIDFTNSSPNGPNSAPISSDRALNAPSIQKMALERSLELRQIDHLINNAKLQKREYYFNWADPDVPSYMSLSFSLIPYISKASRVIDRLLVKREALVAQISTRVENAVTNYNYALENYDTVEYGRDRCRKRVGEMCQDINHAKNPKEVHISAPALQYILNMYFQNQIKLNDVVAIYRISKAQIRRLLWEDYYSQLLPSADER